MDKSFYIVRMHSLERRFYEEAFLANEDAPLYSAPWWLDATCGHDGWEILSYKKPAQVVMPYCRARIRGMQSYVNPPLTQWLPVLQQRNVEGLPLKEMLSPLFDTSILDISLKPLPGISLTDLQLPVHVKYTYLIPAGNSTAQIRKNYNEGLRRNLKEARQAYTVDKSEDIDSLLKLCYATYHQRGIKLPPWFEAVVRRVFDVLRVNHSGYISFIQHGGKKIAGIMIGYDKAAAYYLAGGRTGDEMGASAHALLLDQAISEATEKNLQFDFEGSMQPGVANFFQSFGAVPSPYWHIRKLKGLARIWGILHP